MKWILLICLGAAHPLAADTLPRFPAGAVWNQNIEAAPLHPDSDLMIDTLDGLGGFGGVDFRRIQIDFSLHVVHAAEDAPTRPIVSHPDGFFSPDCEALGTSMPVPLDAAIEGETGLACNNLGNDCHLLVVQGDTLFEAYRVTASGGDALEAQCLVVWHLDVVYPPEGRGEHCTSADAAGFPLDGYNLAARVILNTFKRYGIVLADGGNIALTAESDLCTDTSWSDLGVDSRIFDLTPGAQDVDITDFEVIDTGPRIAETYECVRTVLPMSFSDGFED